MNLQIIQADPLEILSSTRSMIEKAQFVSIHETALDPLADRIVERFGNGLDKRKLGFDSIGDLDENLQLIFIEDAVNFCFWPSKGQPKWEVEWPTGNIVSGGWYGLVACFRRGLAEQIPILDAGYLSTMAMDEARKFFRGTNDIDIPLLQERTDNLREAGKVLIEKFNGRFSNVLKIYGYGSVDIVNAITDNFPSFRDVSLWRGQEVKFLKRAQICSNDLAYALKGTEHEIVKLDQLTAYADYKLPQILREFGVLEYEDPLAEKVDNLIEIPHDSIEEIEIRAATVWAVELLRQRIGKLTAGEIDNTLWFMSQKMEGEPRPYHRTRTIFY